MKNLNTYTFPNGVKLVHKRVEATEVAHCGFVLGIGSRDESDHERGIAHFWEHMAFKGTSQRSSYDLFDTIESVGGELNAYTSKENICLYLSILEKHYKDAINVLADITFNSTFPDIEIEKEKSVILEEMAMYEDEPSDAIYDQFDEVIFEGHDLNYNILGTEESVKSITKNHFIQFIEKNLATDQIIFSYVGKTSFEEVLEILSKDLLNISTKKISQKRIPAPSLPPKKVVVKKSVSQSHCVLGVRVCGLKHKDRLGLSLLTNLLGGPMMSSKLNLVIREEHALVYQIEAGLTAYTDTGVFSIYFACDESRLNKCKKLIYAELEKLVRSPLSPKELKRAKEQYKGQMAMGEENNTSMMLIHAKLLLNHQKIKEIQEVFSEIDVFTSQELLDIANRYLQPSMFSELSYLPE